MLLSSVGAHDLSSVSAWFSAFPFGLYKHIQRGVYRHSPQQNLNLIKVFSNFEVLLVLIVLLCSSKLKDHGYPCASYDQEVFYIWRCSQGPFCCICIPISFLNQPLFHDLLSLADEDFRFEHPIGDLTIPCREDVFIDLTSQLRNWKTKLSKQFVR